VFRYPGKQRVLENSVSPTGQRRPAFAPGHGLTFQLPQFFLLAEYIVYAKSPSQAVRDFISVTQKSIQVYSIYQKRQKVF